MRGAVGPAAARSLEPQQIAERSGRPAAIAHLDQRADDVAYHVFQKPRPRHFVHEQAAAACERLLRPRRARNGAGCVVGAGFTSLTTARRSWNDAKSCSPTSCARRRSSRPDRASARYASAKRRWNGLMHGRVADPIAIHLRARGKARVETGGAIFRREHADVFRKPRVERPEQVAFARSRSLSLKLAT